MRLIATTLSLLSLLVFIITMIAGLKAGHGQEFFMSHLFWAFGGLAILILTLALSLMFIWKMQGIIHTLIAKIEKLEGDS
jgi:hypothetical protein